MFEVGDKVRCLTDKYKMLNKNEIDTVHAIEKNDFIRLQNSKRYKYKTKYFVLSTLPKEETKESDMPIWKNPFKFTNNKPPYKELLSKLKTYNVSIDEWLPEDIQIHLFFHLSKEEDWSKLKTATISIYALKNFLKTSTIITNSHEYRELSKYYEFIPKPNNIDKKLYLVYLLNFQRKGLALFYIIFGSDCILEEDVKLEIINGDITNKILSKDKIMDAPFEYITITPSENKISVKTKKELEHTVFINILSKNGVIPEFILKDIDESKSL